MKSKKKEPEVWLDTAQVMFGWNSKVASEYYKKNPDAKLPPSWIRKKKDVALPLGESQ
jgi:hypothetical protein